MHLYQPATINQEAERSYQLRVMSYEL